MTSEQLTLYGTVIHIYALLAPVVTFLLRPDECKIRYKILPASSTTSFLEESAIKGCTYNTHGLLQHFSSRKTSRANKIRLDYTCCRELLYKRHELSSCKYFYHRHPCLTLDKIKHVVEGECQQISSISYPIIWHLFESASCQSSLVKLRGQLCCEIARPRCVHSNDSCEILVNERYNCLPPSANEYIAQTECFKKKKKLHTFELRSNCTVWNWITEKWFVGYKQVMYACCPETSVKKAHIGECKFKEVTDYCQAGHTKTQPLCPNEGLGVFEATSEQRCDCPGGPEGELVTYACCRNPDICPRIPSTAFPYDYSFDNTSHNGSDITYTVACHEGSLQRVCSRKGNQAAWGIEVNNGCKTADMVMTEAIRDTENVIQPSNDEVDDVVNKIGSVVEEAAKNKALAKKMLSVVGNLMKMDDKIILKAKKESGRHKVVSMIESFSSLLKMLNNCVSNVVATEEISVGTHCIDRRSKALVVESNFQKEDALGRPKTIKGPLVAMSSDVIESLQVGSDKVQLIAYSSPKLFVNAKTVNYSSKYNVITVLSDQNMTFETNQTVVLYKIPMEKGDSRNFTCVYWDTKTGNWSADGIDLITDKNGDKICRSTHLSSFYILMDIDPGQRLSEIDESYLTYISYIGCGVSIIGLLLTILTYALFKSLHGDVSGKILLNICFSMLFLNVVFLLGSLDSETYGVEICMAVAISLHYFLLSTLLWMMIEALNMYQMLIVVFSEHRRWYMRIRLLAGWGVPLVAVGVTMAVSIDNYKPNNQFCFLSHTNQAAFFAAVLAPTCIILFVNTYVFIRVSVIVLRSAKSLKDTRSSTSTVSITQVRGAMSVMIVLGITWILGPLAIGPAKVVFAYMFTILNSIQGFLVFLFRCAFNSEARISWQYFIATGKLKKNRGTFLESSTGTWTRSTEHRRKTRKYKSVSASDSGSSLQYRKEHTFPDDLNKTPRSIEHERNFGEFKREHDTQQGSYRERDYINDIDRKCSEISSKDSHVDRSPSRGFVEPETVGASSTKRFDSEAFDIRDIKTGSPRTDDSTTSVAQNTDRNRGVTRTESESLSSFDTSWFSTSKQSLRKEVAKMKRNRYGSSQRRMTSKQPTEPSSLSTSQTVRGGLTRIRSGRYRYGNTGTSRTNVSKQPSVLSMSLGEGRMGENVNRHGYETTEANVSRNPSWIPTSQMSLRKEVAKLKKKPHVYGTANISQTRISRHRLDI